LKTTITATLILTDMLFDDSFYCGLCA